MKYEAALILHKKARIPMPKIIAILSEHGNSKKAAVKGALKR